MPNREERIRALKAELTELDRQIQVHRQNLARHLTQISSLYPERCLTAMNTVRGLQSDATALYGLLAVYDAKKYELLCWEKEP